MDQLNDPAAERAVIASVIRGGAEAFADLADIVTTRTFTIDSNQTIWKCIEQVCRDANIAQLDYPTLMSAANTLGVGTLLSQPVEQQHLRSVMNMPVRSENARRLAGKIRKLEVARLLDDQLSFARENLYSVTGEESIDAIMAKVEAPIFDFTTLLANADTQGIRLMGEGAYDYLKYLADNPRQMMGISTGLPKFDESIGGGLRPNSLDLIAARPKTGKTMLVDHVALHVAGKLGIPVLNLDTEMSWEEHLHRVAANMAGVPTRDIERGLYPRPEDMGKVLEAAKRLKDYPYYYRCITGEPFEDTLSHMRRWILRQVGVQENGKARPCVIIFDYLKLMSSDSLKSGNLSEWQMLGFITTALKNFASRYGVPILCFAQLNRDGIDKEDTSVISQSDRIIWFCTSFSIYKWKSEEERSEDSNQKNPFTHKLVPMVSRHGEGLRDGDYINIRANYKIARVEEGPTRRELEKGQGLSKGDKGIIVDDTTGQATIDFAGEAA